MMTLQEALRVSISNANTGKVKTFGEIVKGDIVYMIQSSDNRIQKYLIDSTRSSKVSTLFLVNIEEPKSKAQDINKVLFYLNKTAKIPVIAPVHYSCYWKYFMDNLTICATSEEELIQVKDQIEKYFI